MVCDPKVHSINRVVELIPDCFRIAPLYKSGNCIINIE